jgi:hypothetical protein
MSDKHDAVVDTDAVRHDAAGKSETVGWAEKLLGSQVVHKVEAARAKARDQFNQRVAQAQDRLGNLEKLAQHLREEAVQRAGKLRDDARHRVEHTVEQVTHDVGAKLGPIEQLLKMPADMREDVLTNLGVASAKQVAHLHEEIAALSASLSAQMIAQTEALSHLIGKGEVPDVAAKPARRGKPQAHA